MEKSGLFNVDLVSDRDIIARDARPLECDLSADEFRTRGYQLARELSTLELHDATESDKRKLAKSAGEVIKGRVQLFKKAIETNREDRIIDCVTYFEGSKIKIARLDTREVIEQRIATLHELQIHMPGMANPGGVVAEAARRTRAVPTDDGSPSSDVSDDDRDYTMTEWAPPVGAADVSSGAMLELSAGAFEPLARSPKGSAKGSAKGKGKGKGKS